MGVPFMIFLALTASKMAYLAKKDSLCIGYPKKVPFQKWKFGQGDAPILPFFCKDRKNSEKSIGRSIGLKYSFWHVFDPKIGSYLVSTAI